MTNVNLNQLYADYTKANLEGLEKILSLVVPASPLSAPPVVEQPVQVVPAPPVRKPEPVIDPKPNHTSDKRLPLYIGFDKACANNGHCPFASTCKFKGKVGLAPECGENIHNVKKVAMAAGEFHIKVSTSDHTPDYVLKNGVIIGEVKRIPNNKEIAHTLLNKYIGKTIRVVTDLNPKSVSNSLYTMLFAEFAGVVDEPVAPPTPKPITIEEPPYQPEEAGTIDFSDFVLPY